MSLLADKEDKIKPANHLKNQPSEQSKKQPKPRIQETIAKSSSNPIESNPGEQIEQSKRILPNHAKQIRQTGGSKSNQPSENQAARVAASKHSSRLESNHKNQLAEPINQPKANPRSKEQTKSQQATIRASNHQPNQEIKANSQASRIKAAKSSSKIQINSTQPHQIKAGSKPYQIINQFSAKQLPLRVSCLASGNGFRHCSCSWGQHKLLSRTKGMTVSCWLAAGEQLDSTQTTTPTRNKREPAYPLLSIIASCLLCTVPRSSQPLQFMIQTQAA
jgi:hypothetical protein